MVLFVCLFLMLICLIVNLLLKLFMKFLFVIGLGCVFGSMRIVTVYVSIVIWLILLLCGIFVAAILVSSIVAFDLLVLTNGLIVILRTLFWLSGCFFGSLFGGFVGRVVLLRW